MNLQATFLASRPSRVCIEHELEPDVAWQHNEWMSFKNTTMIGHFPKTSVGIPLCIASFLAHYENVINWVFCDLLSLLSLKTLIKIIRIYNLSYILPVYGQKRVI